MKLRFLLKLAGEFGLFLVLFDGVVVGQDRGLVAKWSFDGATATATHDSVSGVLDRVGGHFSLVPGVSCALMDIPPVSSGP